MTANDTTEMTTRVTSLRHRARTVNLSTVGGRRRASALAQLGPERREDRRRGLDPLVEVEPEATELVGDERQVLRLAVGAPDHPDDLGVHQRENPPDVEEGVGLVLGDQPVELPRHLDLAGL